jgi:N-acetylglutamate synthase-like GNAT family acetyltransferase
MDKGILEFRKDDYLISTDQNRLEIEIIYGFLSQSYWANNRTRQAAERALAHSLCFGMYTREEQIGFARVVTDFATIAWLADVFILKNYRGRGLSKCLMDCILAHPDLQEIRRWMLATRDAKGLYQQFGFVDLHNPERIMEIFRSDL